MIKYPVLGIDWDVFTRDDGFMQVQRVDEAETMTDDEAIAEARKLKMRIDDDGFLLTKQGTRKELSASVKKRNAVLRAAGLPWEQPTN